MGPAVRNLDLVGTPRTLDTEWKTKKSHINGGETIGHR